MSIRWKPRLASLALLPLLATAAAPAAAEPAPGSRYVAIGSSFAAGPGVLRRVPGSPRGCGRSDVNYAHILAQRHKLALVDVTCSGATTADVLTRRQFDQPPQVEAVDANTKLVTITIGGNDVSYMGNLIAASCLTRRGPTLGATRCHPVAEAEVERVFGELAQRMTAVATAVRERAPHAEIAFVDYFTIIPERGGCEKLLPLTDAQVRAALTVSRRLEEITARIAETQHVRLVKLSTVSAAHNVCAAKPWIEGYEPPVTNPDFHTPPYHPNEAGMIGAADAVDKALFPTR